jgi:hypothetical protein
MQKSGVEVLTLSPNLCHPDFDDKFAQRSYIISTVIRVFIDFSAKP